MEDKPVTHLVMRDEVLAADDPENGRQATGLGLLYWPSDEADLDATLTGLQNSLLTRPDMEMFWGSTEA